MTDYATAKLTINVPGDLEVVASGAQRGAATLLPSAPGLRPRKRFVFETTKPTRYLAVLISRFQSAPPVPLTLTDDGEPLTLVVTANPRQVSKLRAQAAKATDILKFYASLLDDAPYDAFTLALTESDVPGGHSPAYFALLNQPTPMSPFVWANDPVSFPNYPSFFIAHEVAHQWWGQAVGWKNYHEQWLSEGFAQYFAALYAERERGPEQFANVLRQMRKWAVDLSPQGPVYLGYRLGPHPRGGPDVPRAGLQQGGDGAAHAAAPGRRRRFFRRPAGFLCDLAIPEGGHRTTSARRWRRRRPDRSSGSSIGGFSEAGFRRCISAPRSPAAS